MFGPSAKLKQPPQQQHTFSRGPQVNISRSSFNRSHGYKTTFNSGNLVPIYIDEALPGDTFNLSLTSMARMATPIAPIMDNLYCDIFFFAVPIRLLWDNWHKFNGEQENPGESTSFLVPQCNIGAFGVGTLADYFGIPAQGTIGTACAFPFRAYNRIWNDWFRDENLQTRVAVIKTDGPDFLSSYALKKRGKRHDYFTSCLPWPQKGTAVSLPLGTTAPVNLNSTVNYGRLLTTTGGSPSNGTLNVDGNILKNVAATPLKYDPQGTLSADLSLATAATINQLRQAFQMQGLFERDARGGTRYTEIIKNHFGVTSDDQRLQRSEYLGGGSTPINIAPIPQTSNTNATSPQGNLAAIGTFSHSGVGFTKSFTEHCVVIGLMSVRADLNYQQGLDRMWSRSTRYDYYWPALAHLGEQAVLNKEIYATGAATDNDVFGYQERYAEYRFKPSVVTGLLRSGVSGSLDLWHLAQNFTALPVLGDTFIQENPPVSRVIAVPSQPEFIYDSVINLICARPIPVYSVPGLIDHF